MFRFGTNEQITLLPPNKKRMNENEEKETRKDTENSFKGR
jgi:hypothetical protein